ncbi:UNVERIFIED_CONTAM: Secreted RxLR effector protein [Sesamum radiatum]|uniref:Secreted RxLR effector protein n=1 Tax=Sesamum radiatum TaxID=300843 RepID=A0AAW2LB46_SESRA
MAAVLSASLYRTLDALSRGVWQEAHRSGVKTILKYLKMTKDIFLIYGGGELILEGYYDGSFQSDNDDVKSQLGFVFKLNGGVVAWKSSK